MLTSHGSTTAPETTGAPEGSGENTQAGPVSKDDRAKQLAHMSKDELREALGGVPEEDDRTKDELAKAILAQEFSRSGDARQAPASAPEGARAGDAADQPSLLDPTSQEGRAALNNPRHVTEVSRTKALLDAQPKVTVMLPQRAAGQPQLPPVWVQINDHTYSVPRGKQVEVPAEVARIIYESKQHEI